VKQLLYSGIACYFLQIRNNQMPLSINLKGTSAVQRSKKLDVVCCYAEYYTHEDQSNMLYAPIKCWFQGSIANWFESLLYLQRVQVRAFGFHIKGLLG
jgi:hypothetical protein